jgi:hypothetical protein
MQKSPAISRAFLHEIRGFRYFLASFCVEKATLGEELKVKAASTAAFCAPRST